MESSPGPPPVSPAEAACGLSPETLLDAAAVGVLVCDGAGRLLFVNRELESLSGYSAGELIGRQVEVLVPPVLRAGHESHREAHRAAGSPARSLDSVPGLRLRRRDGREVPVDISLSPVRTRQGMVMVAGVHDATGRQRHLREASSLETNRDDTEQWRSRALVEATCEVTRTVMAGSAEDQVMGLAAARARQLVGAETAAIAVGSPEAADLVIEAVDGRDAGFLRGRRVPVAGSLSGRVLREGRRIEIEDARAARTRFWGRGAQKPAGAAVLIPVGAANRRVGVLMLRRKTPFTGMECADLEQFTSAAAFAIDYARVRQELEQVTLLKERERIARDLHDGAIQSLFHLGLMLRWQAGHTADPDVREWSNAAADELDGVIGELRGYIFGLRPELAAAGRLEAALRKLVSDVGSGSLTDVTLEFDRRLGQGLGGSEAEVPKLVAEALSNVVRHARARACRVRLVRQADRALIEVEDDGRGFDTRILRGAGQGLRNLHERARSLGGVVEIDSAPGEGTAVRISIPVTAPVRRRAAAPARRSRRTRAYRAPA